MYSPAVSSLAAFSQSIESWIEDNQVSMTVLIDNSGEVYSEWRFDDPDRYAPYPLEFVLDRNGKIIYLSSNINAAEMTTAIEAAITE